MPCMGMRGEETPHTAAHRSSLCEASAVEANGDPAPWQQRIIELKVLDVFEAAVCHPSCTPLSSCGNNVSCCSFDASAIAPRSSRTRRNCRDVQSSRSVLCPAVSVAHESSCQCPRHCFHSAGHSSRQLRRLYTRSGYAMYVTMYVLSRGREHSTS